MAGDHKRNAGDILMQDLTEANKSSLHLIIEESNNFGETVFRTEARQDVVDAVPTRSGIKKIKHEDDGFITDDEEDNTDQGTKHHNDDPGNNSDGNSSSSESIETAGRSKPSYCDVFRALFSWSLLFERYTVFDLVLNFGAIGLYIFDLITDWLNAFNAYWFRIEEKGDDYRFYFGLTVAVITIPSIAMQAMSWWWEREDNREMKKKQQKEKAIEKKLGIFYYVWFILSHALQIGPVYRYIRTIYYGLKSRYKEKCGSERRWRHYHDKYQGELADVNFVRLLESFLEAAPQIVLQIYIMIKTADVLPITVISVCVSAFGMSSSYVTYQRALRDTLDDKDQLSFIACIVLFIYRTLVNISRILALALLLNTSVLAWLFGLLVHWVLMSVIIIRHKTHFCTPQTEEHVSTLSVRNSQSKVKIHKKNKSHCSPQSKEYFYDIVIGYCYMFSYINVHADNLNACRMLLYYWLMFLENSIMALCWYYYHNDGSLLSELTGGDRPTDSSPEDTFSPSTALGLLVAVVGSFCLGMLFLAVYYLFFHPKAPVKLCQGKKREKTITKNDTDPIPGQFSVTDSTQTEPVEPPPAPVAKTRKRKSFKRTALRKLYVQVVDKAGSAAWSV